MKYYIGETFFAYSWDQVALAFWRRYPNPYSKHVLSEDVISREVHNGVLHSKRLLTKTNPAPSSANYFVGKLRNVLIVEESFIDCKAKTIVTYTRNFGALSGVMRVDERVEYRVHATETQHTGVTRQAWVSSNIRGFSSLVTAVGYERFKKNAVKAYNGFVHVLESVAGSPGEVSGSLVSAEKLKVLGAETHERVREQAEKARGKARQLAQKADAGAKDLRDLAPNAKSAQ